MHKLNSPKFFIYTGHVGFILLMALSVFFYQERVLFIDTVFQFFKIVNFEHFNIEAARYGTFITQIPVLAALKAGAGLKTLALVYSLSFIAVYYGVFILCAHILKNTAAGLAVLFSLVICVSKSFYHPCTETHQAIVYSLLVYALLRFSFRHALIKYLLAGAAMLLSFYSHPVALFTVLFVIFFYVTEQKKWHEKGNYLLLLVIIALTLAKLLTAREGSYESSFFNELFSFRYSASNIYHSYSFRFFIKRLPGMYFWTGIVFILAITMLFLKKQKFTAFYVLFSSAIFFFITLVTYSKGDADVMMERSFMPLAVFALLPFFVALEQFRGAKWHIFAPILLVVIFTVSVARIVGEGKISRNRVAYVMGIIDGTKAAPGRKFLLEKTGEVKQSVLYTWPFAFTTLVASSLEGPENSRTIYLYDNAENIMKYANGEMGHIFLGADFWLEWQSDVLNKKYFSLPFGKYTFLQQ
ncbi:MAG: hypothetical protein JXB34_03040 [Bacteroidales bacterium]|nr:hypothetical protein [Bacteroidales bacterium]